MRHFVTSLRLAALSLVVLTACGSPVEDGTRLSQFQEGDYSWFDNISFTEVRVYPWSGNDLKSPHFKDVMNHTDDRYLSDEGSTNAHETMHGLLNQMNNATLAADQFVYYQQGKGAYVLEPQMSATRIRDFVPAGVKKMAQGRYQLYLIDQVNSSFKNVLYQFDEWTAYVTGARVGTEMFKAGTWPNQGQDVVDGAMDFLCFASAAALALKTNEPLYFNTNTQFKAAYAMNVEQSVTYIKEGLTMKPFQGFHAKALLEHFQTSPENAAIRAMLVEWYGPAWTQRVLGF